MAFDRWSDLRLPHSQSEPTDLPPRSQLPSTSKESPAWFTSRHLLGAPKSKLSSSVILLITTASHDLPCFCCHSPPIHLHTEARVIFENNYFLHHLHPTPFKRLLWFSTPLRIKSKLLSLDGKSQCTYPSSIFFTPLSLTHYIPDTLTFNMMPGSV